MSRARRAALPRSRPVRTLARMRTPAHLASWAPFLFLLGACGPADAGLRMEAPLGLTEKDLGFEMIVPENNPISMPKAELGKTLFFDPRLSGSGKTSCATCHLPEQAWTDGKRFSPKDDGTLNTRNTPTVYNTGYLPNLYWDGRAEGLEANVLAAWKAQMSGDPDAAAKQLAAVAGYRPMFQEAFGAEPSGERIVQALATFLRLLRSGDSPFDRWKAGDQIAVSNEAKEGWEIFEGRGACIQCHVPKLFTDRIYHNAGIGSQDAAPDPGRGKIDPARPGAFKTPSQREIGRTAPYFHDGSMATLEEAVRLMGKGGIANPNRDPLLQDRNLSDQDVAKIAAFLRSLSTDQKFTPPTLPQ